MQAKLEQAEAKEREYSKFRSRATTASEQADKLQADLASSQAALHAALDRNDKLSQDLSDACSSVKVMQGLVLALTYTVVQYWQALTKRIIFFAVVKNCVVRAESVECTDIVLNG